MSRSLEGRSALIVGAASGLGAATARLFAREGAVLTLVDMNAGLLDEFAASLREEGAGTVTVVGDASAPAIVDKAVSAAHGAFGRIDILFNNVGIDPLGATTVVDTTVEQWDAIMAVNVRSAFLFCRAVIPVMAAGGGGAIVNTASIAGLKPGAGEAAYNVSKAALVQLTRSVAIDHAAQDIRSNCLCPGYLESVMSDRRSDMDPAALAERSRRAAATVPLRREGRYDEIARSVLYLADPLQSGYMTGASLTIDGGLSLA